MASGGDAAKGSLSPLLPCSGCGVIYGKCDLDFLDRCETCFRAYVERPTGTGLPAPVVKVRLKTKQASQAHIKDIRSRKLAEDGKSVIREKAPRSYFTV